MTDGISIDSTRSQNMSIDAGDELDDQRGRMHSVGDEETVSDKLDNLWFCL